MRRPDDRERVAEMDAWYEENADEYAQQLDLVRALLPHFGPRLEVGAGTAQFARPLGVEVGLDPSRAMCRRARERGIAAVRGIGERLPFKSGTFDAALLVNTLFLLDDRRGALGEIRRVLRPASALVVGFTDAASRLGKHRRERYRKELETLGRSFLTAEKVTALLLECGFLPIATAQTLLGPPGKPHLIPGWEAGHGRGGFVVIKALV